MTKITCSTHGRQDETFVCKHIIESLASGEARGFFYSYSDGAFEAVCASCNDLGPEEAMAREPDLIQTLCYGCFRDVAALNGVDID